MIYAKFGFNWPISYGEEFFFLYFVNIFLLFRDYLPLKKDMTLPLNKSPSPKDALCQVWLKVTWWFWRKYFFLKTSSMYFHFFLIIYPCRVLNKLESPLPKLYAKVGLKLTQWFFCQCILANFKLSPFGKGRGHSFQQSWIPFT